MAQPHSRQSDSSVWRHSEKGEDDMVKGETTVKTTYGALQSVWILIIVLTTFPACGGEAADNLHASRRRQSARAFASIVLVAPADLAVVESTFTVEFEVHGADRLLPGTYAAVLLNNNHGANFTINTSVPVHVASLGVKDMNQMVYDITIALMGPSGKYAGVYNMTTVGVINSSSSVQWMPRSQN